MAKLVIFGTGEIGELAWHYFSTDSEHDVVGFAIDRAFLNDTSFCGLPVVPFEEVSESFAPKNHAFFIALSYSRINALRREKYLAAKAKGFSFVSYVSRRAAMLTEKPIGENCFILEHNTIQPFASIGNNVTLWSGNHIGHHSTIHDHCFLASHVVVSGGVDIGESCFIGVNATLRDHIKVGARCVVGAGALLLSDAEPDGVYLGHETERSRVPSNRLRSI